MDSMSSLLIIVSTILSVASGTTSVNILQRTLPAYAIALRAETSVNSSACGRELGLFRNAVDIRKRWALKMLDASGQPKSGFIDGNNAWLGDRFQCRDIANNDPFFLNQEFLRNLSRFRKAEDEYPPYDVIYFVARFQHNSTMQNSFNLPFELQNLMSLGLCLPRTCTTDQLGSILETMFRERTLAFGEQYEADFRLVNVTDLQDDRAWLKDVRMIIVLSIVVLVLLLVMAGTACDVLVCRKHSNVKKTSSDTRGDGNENSLDDERATAAIPEAQARPETERFGLFSRVLKCFSIRANTKYVFSTGERSESIKPIDGLRALSILWVIGIHVTFFTLDSLENMTRLWRILAEFWTQPLINPSCATDTFFFMSGFLMAYTNFKYNLKDKTRKKPVDYKAKMSEFANAIWKRFLRLTPAYIMLIGIAEITYAWHDKTSAIELTHERPQETCAKYWWRNLLYINNLFPLNEMCLSWSWYLANDMQFFVLGNFLIALSTVYFYTAATILGAILLSSIVLTGYISYIVGYEPSVEDILRTFDVLYGAPWARIGPYIVGMIAAYILVRLNNKLRLRRIYVVALWVLTTACNLLVVFGLWNTQISVLTSAFYTALSHTAWGIGMAWIIIACCTDNGGIANTIFSWGGWIPFSRLSYCAYLLNPLIITSFYHQREIAPHVDHPSILLMTVGLTVVTFALSYAYNMTMETPYTKLVRLFSKPRTKL